MPTLCNIEITEGWNFLNYQLRMWELQLVHVVEWPLRETTDLAKWPYFYSAWPPLPQTPYCVKPSGLIETWAFRLPSQWLPYWPPASQISIVSASGKEYLILVPPLHALLTDGPLFVGRFFPPWGIDALVDLFPEIAKNNIEWESISVFI